MSPRPVRDIIPCEIIEDLWGAGYTILPRTRGPDPFEVDPKMVPATRSYQWMHLVHDRAMFEHNGWAPVPASRHDGYFMPAGHVGNIEVSGLGLFEKPKFEVEAERNANTEKAAQLVADWVKQVASDGISGSVSVGGIGVDVGEGEKVFKNVSAKTIETTTKIPGDMLPHMSEVFAERDRLYAELQERCRFDVALDDWETAVLDKYEQAQREDHSILKGPTFNALLLPIAVENVRKKIGIKTPMLDKLRALKEQKS